MVQNTNTDKFQFVALDSLKSERIDAPKYSYWKSVGRKFFSSKVAISMLIVLLIILGFSFIHPLISQYDFMDVEGINDFSNRYNCLLKEIGLERTQMDNLYLMLFGQGPGLLFQSAYWQPSLQQLWALS